MLLRNDDIVKISRPALPEPLKIGSQHSRASQKQLIQQIKSRGIQDLISMRFLQAVQLWIQRPQQQDHSVADGEASFMEMGSSKARLQLPLLTSRFTFQVGGQSRMSQQKRTLSFALNPLSNKIEFISVPEVASTPQNDPPQSRTPLPRRKNNIVLSGARAAQLERTADTLEKNGMKGGESQQSCDLNDLLTSLMLSAGEEGQFQDELKEVVVVGRKTAVELLVMMDYTQKLSYVRSKCQSKPCLAEKISLEIARAAKLIMREQDIYCACLCAQFLPGLIQ